MQPDGKPMIGKSMSIDGSPPPDYEVTPPLEAELAQVLLLPEELDGLG